MRNVISTAMALAVVFCLSLSGDCLAAGGSSAPETKAPSEAQLTPEQQADAYYNEGLSYRDAAWKLTKKMETEKELRGNYERAAKLYAKAIDLNPAHYQALGALGYASRQLGDFKAALQAYDAALAIKPDYGNAIEYRGEAYLGLGRINDAQNAYRLLTEKEPALASELLGSMTAWIEARRAQPDGVSLAQLDGLATWIADRELSATGSTRHKGNW